MGKVLQMTSANDINWAQSPSEVSFSPICMNYGDDGFSSTEETEVDVTCKFTTIFSSLSCHIASNTLTTATTTITFRKNGANGNGTVTILAGLTGTFADATNTDSLVSGDKYNAQVSTAAGGTGSLAFGGIGIVASAVGSHTIQYGSAFTANIAVVASTTYYFAIAGETINSTISNAQITIGVAGVMSKAQVYFANNLRTTSTTIRSNINGSNGNILITVGGLLTGLFEDASNTDTLAADDKFCWEVQTGTGTGSLGTRRMNVNYTTTSGRTSTVIARTTLGISRNSGQTTRAPLGGCIPPAIATEAEVQCRANFPFTATKLRIGVSANTFSASSTCVLRKNGANTALSITVPSATTGIFSDTSNSVDFLGTDLVNYSWSGGTTGSGTAVYFQVDMEDKTATGSPQIIFF